MGSNTRAIWGDDSREQNGHVADPVSGVMVDMNNGGLTKLCDSESEENAKVGDATGTHRDSNRDHEHGGSPDTQSSTNGSPSAFKEADPTAVESNRKSIDGKPTADAAEPSSSDDNGIDPNHQPTNPSSPPEQTQPTEPPKHEAKPATNSHQETLPGSVSPLIPPATSNHPTVASAPKKEGQSRGTGEKYIKSTGFAADGGDFDATRPGAGREADRLLEEAGAGISHEPRNKGPPGGPVVAKKGLGERLRGKIQHVGGNGGEGDGGEKKGLGEKVKERMHLGKH